MKKTLSKLFFIALAAVMITACQYDDTKIWEKVNDLSTRVEAIEKAEKQSNSDISALQTLVTNLQKNVTVTSVTKTDDGYAIAFSDGTKASLTNGSDGKNGIDAPTVSVKQDTDGIYYWTLGGEWLKDTAGYKIKAQGTDGKDGANAIAPQVRIDSESGMWEISTDSGKNWTSTGVKAQGTGAESMFKSIESKDGIVTVTLADGTAIKLQAVVEMECSICRSKAAVESFIFGETKTFDIHTAGVSDCTISRPDGWKAAYNDGKISITAPVAANTFADRDGEICIIATATNGTCKIVRQQVKAVESEVRTLTFEDPDYDAPANFIGKYSWSSLVDDAQYGGTLLYGANSAAYSWYDENNTYLASELTDSYGDGKFWGGGQAISNYVDTVLANGDYTKQLEVCYIDPKTGKGGHNGSDNFCVDFGYHDNSGYTSEKIPYFYFADGKARVVKSMYVTLTTYLANSLVNGSGFSPKATENDYVKIIARAYDGNGEKTDRTSEFFLLQTGLKYTDSWSEWDLSSLGKVSKIDFNITGSFDNGYGLSIPAYFAYDDVAVIFE